MELCVYPSKTIFILRCRASETGNEWLLFPGSDAVLRSPLGGQAPPLPISFSLEPLLLALTPYDSTGIGSAKPQFYVVGGFGAARPRIVCSEVLGVTPAAFQLT